MRRFFQSTRQDTEQLLSSFFLIALVSLVIYSGVAERLNLVIYDSLLKISPAPVADEAVIIAIDQKSLTALGQWPWPRQIHAELLHKLKDSASGPVAFDILFTEPDSHDQTSDIRFATAIAQHGNVFLPVHVFPQYFSSTLTEILPLPDLIANAAGIAHVHVELDQDGIARGLYLKEGIGSPYWPALSLALAMHVNHDLKLPVPLNASAVPAYVMVRAGYIQIPFVGVSGSIPAFSYIDVLNGTIPAASLAGKTIFIGATAAGFGDVLPTPVSGLSAAMPGVEFHANAYSALVNSATINRLPAYWIYLLTYALILIPILLFPRISPGKSLPILLSGVTGIVIFCYLLLFAEKLWFPPAAALSGMLASYPAWSWQRLKQMDSYLSKELTKLQNEPVMHRSDDWQALPEIQKMTHEVNTLALLLDTRDCRLTYGKEVILDSQTPTSLPSKPLPQNQWYHFSDSSWLQSGKYCIALFWKDGTNLDKKRQFLHRQTGLTSTTALPPSIPALHERMADRIAQVQAAVTKVREMREFIFQTFRNMPDGIIVTNTRGQIIFVNGHVGSWFSIDENAILGRSVLTLLETHQPDHSNWQHLLQKVLIEHRPVQTSSSTQGRELMFSFESIIGQPESETGMIVNISDITLLRQQQREKENLINFLSHDVRAPLAAQALVLEQLVQKEREPDSETLALLVKQNTRSLSLAEQFVQLSRAQHLDANKFYDLDLVQVLENAIDEVDLQASSKNCDILFHTQPESFWIKGDAELLERAFINLLSNAIKFNPVGGWIKVHCSLDAQDLSITIEDCGSGISQDLQTRLFEPFQRERNSQAAGSGLGLTFVHTTLEKHQGKISLIPKAPPGTIFRVWLPATQFST